MPRRLCTLCFVLCFTASLHAENAPKFVELKGHTVEVYSATFSPDGKKIVTASEDGVRIWDAESGKEMHKWTTFPLGAMSAYFSSDGKTILTTHVVGVVIRDAETGKVLRNLRGHTGIINTAVFSPDGTKIVTASYDKTARIWDTETGKELHKLEGHTGFVMSAAFSPDGKKVITSGSGNGVMTIGGGLLFSERTLVAEDDKTYRIWDVETGKELKKSKEHLNGIDSAAFSPDETKIITTGTTSGADIWDAVTGKQLYQLNEAVAIMHFAIESACFSPDGKKIVTTAHTLRHAQIWDAESGKKLQKLEGHTDRISSAVFSPDSKKVATASWDKTARIWTLE